MPEPNLPNPLTYRRLELGFTRLQIGAHRPTELYLGAQAWVEFREHFGEIPTFHSATLHRLPASYPPDAVVFVGGAISLTRLEAAYAPKS